ncbi:hypothetical protein SJAG_04557 [Schizosaccharomyces japonicus yFS275]|uniref:Uncharacterized protein n=1 Tax=Schizosaccharomyces japonicus (strain yFS275 / FY16936) TaxID=402676 RepID=B6K752_SCHJY|nr:hypothetical protein SJAG_04557 [Schizosaccharomyces japonicus yFS275]EEB09356.1 hypothetical protein SJAG_04557 [Schizosaccharomyces japonicus yFS275]
MAEEVFEFTPVQRHLSNKAAAAALKQCASVSVQSVSRPSSQLSHRHTTPECKGQRNLFSVRTKYLAIRSKSCLNKQCCAFAPSYIREHDFSAWLFGKQAQNPPYAQTSIPMVDLAAGNAGTAKSAAIRPCTGVVSPTLEQSALAHALADLHIRDPTYELRSLEPISSNDDEAVDDDNNVNTNNNARPLRYRSSSTTNLHSTPVMYDGLRSQYAGSFDCLHRSLTDLCRKPNPPAAAGNPRFASMRIYRERHAKRQTSSASNTPPISYPAHCRSQMANAHSCLSSPHSSVIQLNELASDPTNSDFSVAEADTADVSYQLRHTPSRQSCCVRQAPSIRSLAPSIHSASSSLASNPKENRLFQSMHGNKSSSNRSYFFRRRRKRGAEDSASADGNHKVKRRSRWRNIKRHVRDFFLIFK